MSGKYWIGLLFIVLGFGFLLHQADIWDFSNVLSTWWPLIVIGIGVIHIVNSTYSYLPGFIFILIGGFFLVDRSVDMDLIPYLWPLILITIGLTFIFSKVHHKTHKDSNQIIDTFSLFSGVDLKSQSQKFEGGSVTALFGGAEIDLRETALSEEGAALDLTALFGGSPFLFLSMSKWKLPAFPSLAAGITR
ncbi:hypothetical protein JNUCC1_00826 [Lentibacillus sp. JNUCC-1]|uniref:LiaF transmembrane domain-containing protein n=1 Tax=Lentibacillus sp. JNUCC-1 TaxID=2654513 RepID=UPI0012E8AC1B|nr:DUF5668 domain-containing protein [Lentibacillus sp. JNUCC-1]MUV37020.1 hypothetical protein [Lentibacillus sp. JNUCC-1]